MPSLYYFDLEDAPELAALDILFRALEVSEQALLSTHTDLAAGEGTSSMEPKSWIADLIITQMQILRKTIRRYQKAVDAQDKSPAFD